MILPFGNIARRANELDFKDNVSRHAASKQALTISQWRWPTNVTCAPIPTAYAGLPLHPLRAASEADK
jgi:hypothetical protein